ncbi:alpha/beta hydrolase [Accumulibacter sp.]|uniref:alpha/beta hydrolase n=1 Tax=Accumulibacter sp. TaxID=2053492 RepID=UPI002633CE7D|nr:alpha/beta hydrolase [Accumulibacter sp.]
MLVTSTGHAVERLCARGQAFEPGREFLQTRQIEVTIEGPTPRELLAPIVKRAIQETLWQGVTTVFVETFDDAICGAQPVVQLTLRLTAADLAAILADSERGTAEQSPALRATAQRATSNPPPPLERPAGTPEGAKRYDWLRVYFATTRQATGVTASSEAFGSTVDDRLSFGVVNVSIPSDHRYANLESPSLIRLEWDSRPDRHVMIAPTFSTLGAQAWKRELASEAVTFGKPGVLLFVHGYNSSFANAAQRAAQLAYDISFPGPTVVFSWPSDAELLSYVKDEEAARTSWRQLADVLDTLSTLGTGVPVYVVAHSMGTRVLVESLGYLFRQRPDADVAFRQIVLAAPDIGYRDFRDRWISDLRGTAPRFTMYASSHDIPVQVSAWLHGQQRLGNGGHGIAVLPNLDSIDASDVTREWFGLSHSYFGDTNTVMSDLFLLIHGGASPERRPRLEATQGANGQYYKFRP